ncbi:MAG TPA: DoxX family protein [Candidatus Elarobacter sp.]|jgi:putative oxidoreductase|nr:DoxX family protein [Candidatus Elarobacter sp.]
MELALPLLLVRLVIGLAFAAHGAQKLFGWFGGYGLAGTGGFFETIGFKPGRLFAGAAGFAEFVGGLLLALGLGGPIGPMFIISAMLVAIVVVHLRNGFFASSNGVELPLLYLLVAVFYAFAGFGTLSLDAVLGWSAVWTAGLIWLFVVLGFVGGFANVAARRKPAPAPSAPEGLDPAV